MIGHGVPVYRSYASQYGHGFGNVLGGLVRSALPIVGKIAKSAGHKLLDTGLNYLSETSTYPKAKRHHTEEPQLKTPLRPTLHPKPHKRRHHSAKRHKADIFA